MSTFLRDIKDLFKRHEKKQYQYQTQFKNGKTQLLQLVGQKYYKIGDRTSFYTFSSFTLELTGISIFELGLVLVLLFFSRLNGA